MPVLMFDWRAGGVAGFIHGLGSPGWGMALFALWSLNVLYDENVTIKAGQKEAFWSSPALSTSRRGWQEETEETRTQMCGSIEQDGASWPI